MWELISRRSSRGWHDIALVFSWAAILLPIAYGIPARTQIADSAPGAKVPLQQDYDAAQSYQASGDLPQAILHYKSFIAIGLGRLGDYRVRADDFGQAVSLFEQALSVDAGNAEVKLAYAEACLTMNDSSKARLLAQSVVDSDAKNLRAHRVLGRALSTMGEHEEEKQQFEIAVALEPDFANGYALAAAYLELRDEDSAARIFSEMLASFGDKPEIHLQFGSAFANAGYPENAVAELKKAIAENDKLAGAHYLLGMAYLANVDSPAYEEASAEFQKEVKIHPNDVRSHLELGVIALSQHRLRQAEGELTRAVALDLHDPDPLIHLGQLYEQEDQLTEAEKAFRKAISLTTAVSRKQYQAAQVYYLLARILWEMNRQDEAERELDVANRLLDQSIQANQGEPVAVLANQAGGNKAEALKEAQSFENEIRPAIADSYNNLGVIAAGSNDFAGALADFQRASEWNPLLEGLDYNWGRAAFSSHQYDKAIAPLSRYLQRQSQDSGARSTLALCFFLVQRYEEALKTFQLISKTQIDSVSVLAFAYAVSLSKAGDYDLGVRRLEALEASDPNNTNIHKALGEAFAAHGNYTKAEEELSTAVRQDPSDKEAEREFNSVKALLTRSPN